MTRWKRSESRTNERAVAGTAARRQGTVRIGDLRLWAGIGLLGLSVAAGAVLLGEDDDTVTVLRASRDLSAGAPADAVEAVSVSSTVAEHYLRPGEALDGILRWPVSAGELVPRTALAAPEHEATRRITVPVDPLHAPVGLQPGEVVDVWSMPQAEVSGEPDLTSQPVLVLPAAIVSSVTEEAIGIGGELGVVLEVREDLVPAVVAAAHAGALDLVSVPVSSQVGPA